MNLLIILEGLLGLGLMVFIHELGHFIAARAVGIQVDAFALGWGPTVLKYKGKYTEYRLAAFPIGGYCKMKGEQDMVDALQNKTEYLEASQGSFFAAKPWKRIVVSFAGPLVNLLFAIVVLSLVWLIGYSYSSPDNRIILAADSQISLNADNVSLQSLNTQASPAAKAGLKSGDRIVSINGISTPNWSEIYANTVVSARQELHFKIQRADTHFDTTVVPILDTESGRGMIGISPWVEPVIGQVAGTAATGHLQVGDRIISINGVPTELDFQVAHAIKEARGQMEVIVQRAGHNVTLQVFPEYQPDGTPTLKIAYALPSYHTPSLNLPQSFVRGTQETLNLVGMTAKGIALLFQGLNPLKAVQGPVRIVKIIGEVTQSGFSESFTTGLRAFFHILAFISVALFFGNLLPIPALDGGQILLFTWESITRRPLKMKLVQRYQLIGAFMVFSLLILAISGDIMSLFSK